MDYLLEHFQGLPLISYPNVNHKFNWELPIYPQFKNYSLPDDLEEFKIKTVKERQAKGQVVFDGQCFGLGSDIETLSKADSVELKNTTYFTSLASHEAYSQEKYKSRIDPYLFQDNQLISLKDSLLPNTIGVSTILICSDDMVALHQIGQGNAVGKIKSISVSGAGSLNLAHYNNKSSFKDLLVAGMNAEVFEESGLPKEADIKTEITGYARLLHRAGMPQFYGISTTNLTSKDLQEEVDDSEKDFVINKFFMPFELLLNDTLKNASHALEVTLDRARKTI